MWWSRKYGLRHAFKRGLKKTVIFTRFFFRIHFRVEKNRFFFYPIDTSQSRCSHVVYSTSLKVDRSISFFVSTSKRVHIAPGVRKQMDATKIHTPILPAFQNDCCKPKLKFFSIVIGLRRKYNKNMISRLKNKTKIVSIIPIYVITTKTREIFFALHQRTVVPRNQTPGLQYA